jgi:FHS family L-fucose permease-like MFS transporter
MTSTTAAKREQYLVPFILVTSLFFLWAFLHNINPILIPHLKKACELTDTESALIDTAVYIGYFVMALPAGFFMHRYGYKKGILFGLLLYAAGALLFFPAASARSYLLFLAALFVIASGATFLETVANPYITKLGDPSTAAQRLNFAQSFNGVGAFVAPIIGGQFILSGVEHTPEELNAMTSESRNAYLLSEASTVIVPSIVIGLVVLVVAVLFFIVRIPEIRENDASEEGHQFNFSIFRHRHVAWAVIAQFFYVGAQVCVGSFFIRFGKQMMLLPEKQAALWWGSFAMVGFMAGRFAGTFIMKYVSAPVLLTAYALINILLLSTAMSAEGATAVYAVMAVPFFMSIMFPTIFALGIEGLGEESKIASSFIVMAIVGGAVFPLFMGLISDSTGSMQKAYIVPLICFAVVAYFGWKGHKRNPEMNRA